MNNRDVALSLFSQGLTKRSIAKILGFHEVTIQRWTNPSYEESSKTANRNYYCKNKSRIISSVRKYANKNKERIALKNKLYREKNLEKLKKYDHEYYQKNKIRRRFHSVNYELRKKQRNLKLSREQVDRIKWIYLFRQVASEITGDTYHVDHIVPLKGKTVSGLHVPENLQVILAKENIKKGNRYGS